MNDFWSKRKAAVAAETIAEEQQAQEDVVESQAVGKTDAELLDELGLPDPDSLQLGDDFSVFMQEMVPARLKTRALRKLWRVNPILANVDNLVDYGEDFTDAAMVFENMQTTYQVGKGMMAHVKEMARKAMEQAQSEESAAEEPLETDPGEEDEAERKEMAGDSETIVAAHKDAMIGAPAAEEEIMPSPPRHRMQFYFEDQHRE